MDAEKRLFRTAGSDGRRISGRIRRRVGQTAGMADRFFRICRGSRHFAGQSFLVRRRAVYLTSSKRNGNSANHRHSNAGRPRGGLAVRGFARRRLYRIRFLAAYAERSQKMAAACAKNGAKIVPLPYNPVDTLWTDKPAADIERAVFLPEQYTGLDSTAKIAEITSALGMDQDDALVFSSPESIAWLLNVRGRDIPYVPIVQSFAVLYKNGTVDWFVDPAK